MCQYRFSESNIDLDQVCFDINQRCTTLFCSMVLSLTGFPDGDSMVQPTTPTGGSSLRRPQTSGRRGRRAGRLEDTDARQDEAVGVVVRQGRSRSPRAPKKESFSHERSAGLTSAPCY